MSSSEQTQGGGVAARTATRPPSERDSSADDNTSIAEPRRPKGRPATARPAGGIRPGAPRRVRLTVARLDPWSVMKLAFLLSVALGIALVVASGVLWTVLDGMGVYADVNRVTTEVLGQPFDVLEYIGFAKVLSLATVIAVVNVVLLTALSTLGAFLYNVASSLVGGLHVTLSDD